MLVLKIQWGKKKNEIEHQISQPKGMQIHNLCFMVGKAYVTKIVLYELIIVIKNLTRIPYKSTTQTHS